MNLINYLHTRIIPMCIGLVAGVVLTLPALLLAFISAGGGHGTYLWAKVFFPYTMIIPSLTGGPISLPLFVLVFVQFPVYGILAGASASGFKPLSKMMGIIGGFHVVAVLIGIIFDSGNFS